MGGGSSKKIEALERNQEALMKQNDDLLKRIAEQGEFHKKQHEATVEQMGKLLVILMQSSENETVIKNDKKSIEIEGVTYDITQYVNKGGFGQIYKAQVKNSDRVAAIKVMQNSPAIQEEINNEIKFLRLTKNINIKNHPVIDYYGCKITNEGIYIAMELAVCDLSTFWFNQISEREQQEKFVFGILIIIYVLRALIFLEKLNIIHGDIKPQNLVIVQGDKCFYIKLIDFGTVEKMDTNRAQLTVGIDKAYTLFFASPEFLKRNSNNMVSRHLHKKSDAWAAGVMFYILFFEKLPWKDQYDYENFCNDTNAKDIVVPNEGGYKLIIELLLKKDPRQRSSAKDTLLQIKAHPVLKVIVQSIEDMFYPADDVCKMNVPNNVRQELAKLARPGHYANKQDSTTISGPQGGTTRQCRYGIKCYNNDREHRQEFLHPDDSDYQTKTTTDTQIEKKHCRYGADCFRKDTEHRQRYIHPNDKPSFRDNSSAFTSSEKQTCRFGDGCTRRNDREHMKTFNHPNEKSSFRDNSPVFTSSEKQKCRFGDNCSKRNDREHMKTFLHEN